MSVTGIIATTLTMRMGEKIAESLQADKGAGLVLLKDKIEFCRLRSRHDNACFAAQTASRG